MKLLIVFVALVVVASCDYSLLADEVSTINDFFFDLSSFFDLFSISSSLKSTQKQKRGRQLAILMRTPA